MRVIVSSHLTHGKSHKSSAIVWRWYSIEAAANISEVPVKPVVIWAKTSSFVCHTLFTVWLATWEVQTTFQLISIRRKLINSWIIVTKSKLMGSEIAFQPMHFTPQLSTWFVYLQATKARLNVIGWYDWKHKPECVWYQSLVLLPTYSAYIFRYRFIDINSWQESE